MLEQNLEIPGKLTILIHMNEKEYKDSIQQINDIISKTRTETKLIIETLERLKRTYFFEHKAFNQQIKESKKRINKWKKSKFIEKDICFDCGSKEGIHYHHVVPDSLGGSQTLPLCNDCHGKVHDRKFVDISTLVKEGLRKKKEQGVILGRRKGTGKSNEDTLNNPRYKDAINYLNTNEYSLREISSMCNLALNTVLKLSKILRSK